MGGPILKATVKLLVSFLLLAYLSLHIEWFAVLQALQKTDLKLYLVSTFLLCFQVLLNSGKFYIFLRNSKIQKSFSSIVKINLISRFYAVFLPGSVGRMAVRWYKITENKRERVFFLAVTLFERMLHIAVLLIFCLLPLVVYSYRMEITTLRVIIQPVAIILFTLSTLGISYFLSPSIQHRFKKIFVQGSTGSGKWRNTAAAFFDKFSMPLLNMPVFAMVLSINILWVLFFTCRVFILVKALGLPFNYIDIAWMSCLTLLLQILPISLAGIGVREGAYAYLFSLFSLAPEKGVLLGGLLLSQMGLVALVGGVVELTRK